MTALNPTRRRVERFATLVEADQDVRRQSVVDAHTAELLELVASLRSVPVAESRPEFVADLRERLMLAAETELSPAAADARVAQRLTIAPRKSRHERRVAAALGAFAIIGASTSMAVAAQSALPGDALYPLKRAIENTHANLSVGDQAKGSTILDNAGRRLGEVRSMTRDGDADPDRVSHTLDAFSAEVTQASSLLIKQFQHDGVQAGINELRDFDAHSMLTLSSLEGVVPQESEPALRSAAKTLFTVDYAAGQLCPDCASAGITEIPPTLLASDTGPLDQAQSQLSLEAGSPLATPPTTSSQPGGSTLQQPQHKHHASSTPSTPSTPSTSTPPPATTTPPVSLPTAPASSEVGDVVGGLLGAVTGDTTTGNGGHHKHKPDHQTLPDVVNEVVQGVNGLLGTVTGLPGQ